jgi:hypothetical protein
MALYRAPVFAASQPASRYAERSAPYPAGAPGLEQDGPFQGSSFSRPVTKVYVVVAVKNDIPQIIESSEWSFIIHDTGCALHVHRLSALKHKGF